MYGEKLELEHGNEILDDRTVEALSFRQREWAYNAYNKRNIRHQPPGRR